MDSAEVSVSAYLAPFSFFPSFFFDFVYGGVEVAAVALSAYLVASGLDAAVEVEIIVVVLVVVLVVVVVVPSEEGEVGLLP